MTEVSDRICRVLVVDDSAGIHDDIRKMLQAQARSNRDTQRLKALSSSLFGEEPQIEFNKTQLNIVIDSAYQGQEGLQMVKQAEAGQRPYMLAFVDMRMPPGWDGVETIANIWKVDPFLQVVICTAFSDRSWDEITERLGASDGLLILKKPFEKMELLQVTHALFRKWKLHRELTRKLHDLDAMVRERTKELEMVNAHLNVEVEERKRAQEELKHLATHDPLTGLPNRILMNERLHRATAKARENGKIVALMLLDVDDFKQVNDLHGHDYGDGVLQEFARHLRQAVLGQDGVARLGGDEFVVMLADRDTVEEVDAVARKIFDGFRDPVRIKDRDFLISTSVGISTFPGDSEDVEMLMKTADLAMYRAKQGGKNGYRFYATKDLAEQEAREELLHELEDSLAANALDLNYQPLFDLQTGEIVMLEAMLCWRHPTKGYIKPMTFLPLIEHSDLTHKVAAWVLREACGRNREWRQAGLRAVGIAVNVSMCQFQHDGFVEMIRGIVKETEVPPQQLLLDITESTVLNHFERSKKTARQLADAGIRLVIDDFSSGFATVGKLAEMPLYALKVDTRFRGREASDKEQSAFIASTIAIAHSLGIHVIAEGIETETQLDYLRALKGKSTSRLCCDLGQGHLLGSPLSAAETEKLLREKGRQA